MIATAGPLFEERLGMPRRAWLLFGLALVVGFFAVHPLSAVLIGPSWLYSVLRYRRVRVRVDADTITVGRRRAALAWLDPASLGEARNPWPWRVFTSSYLGANPIWTSGSVRLTGRSPQGRRIIVAVGTNRGTELADTLRTAVPDAVRYAEWLGGPPGALGPPPGWYDDPWADGMAWRWWDGWRWTAFTAPRPRPLWSGVSPDPSPAARPTVTPPGAPPTGPAWQQPPGQLP